jgi:mRNA interferase MazF
MYLAYEPKKGDVVWLDFNPQTGHEQAGRRPALVLTPLLYNKKVGLAVFCPITSKIKDYPFVVVIPDNLKIKGAILSDQVKSFDWRARKAEFICKLPEKLLKEVKEKLRTLLE